MTAKYLIIPALPTKDIIRFWSKVQVTAPDECWLWLASRNADGYGQFKLAITKPNFIAQAHRVVYFLSHPGASQQTDICHTCDNPPCCNLSHLWPGTNEQNVADRCAKGRSASGDHNGLHVHPEKAQRGSLSGVSKLTESQIPVIRRLHNEGTMQLTIAALFRVSPSTVRDILIGKTWRHVT